MTDVDCTNIQPVIRRDRPDLSIQAPYVVRPFYERQLQYCQSVPDEKSVDVLWCGSEVYQMTTRTRITRKEWLDEFQSLLPSGVTFSRNLKIYPMHEYADMIRRSKITLHIHGLGEHCFRLWEILHTGGCAVGQRFIQEKPWQAVEDVVPQFVTPQEAVDACVKILQEQSWSDIELRQRIWYLEHYGQKSRSAWSKQTWAELKELTGSKPY